MEAPTIEETRGLSRTSKNNLRKLGRIAIGIVFGIAIVATGRAYPDWWPVLFILTLLLFLVPGWIIRHFWADLFRGMRDFDEGQFAESKGHFERFLQTVETRPG